MTVFLTPRRRHSPLSWIGVALYAAFLVIAPFEHHDLVCHIKNPQHCTACTANQIGTGPGSPAIGGGGHLSDAGRAVSHLSLAEGVLLPRHSTGRSPPLPL